MSVFTNSSGHLPVSSFYNKGYLLLQSRNISLSDYNPSKDVKNNLAEEKLKFLKNADSGDVMDLKPLNEANIKKIITVKDVIRAPKTDKKEAQDQNEEKETSNGLRRKKKKKRPVYYVTNYGTGTQQSQNWPQQGNWQPTEHFKIPIKTHHKVHHKGHHKRHHKKGIKKFLVPMMVGVMATKLMMLPLILKALALISIKALFLGFFAAIVSSIISLKKLSHHGHENRSVKIQVIPVPVHDHHHLSYKKNHDVYIEEAEPPTEHIHPYHGYY